MINKYLLIALTFYTELPYSMKSTSKFFLNTLCTNSACIQN